MSTRRLCTLGALSGFLCALAFPPFDIPFLSLIALVPLVVGYQALGPLPGLRALVLGGAFGLVHFGVLLLWIVPALGADTRFAPLAYALVVVSAATIPAVSVQAAQRLRYGFGVPAWLALGMAWVGGEWLRGHLGPISFPWVGLATSISDHPVLLAPAAWAGEHLLAFGIVSVNAAWVPLLTLAAGRDGPVGTGGPDRGAPIGGTPTLGAPFVAVLVLAALSWHGRSSVPAGGTDPDSGRSIRVAVVTTDLPRSSDPEGPDAAERIRWARDQLLGPGAGGAIPAVDWIVFPEAFVPVPWSSVPFVERTLRGIGERLGGSVVVGSLSVDHAGHLRNSVVSLGAGPTDLVDKNRRVPWAESGFAPGDVLRPLTLGDHSVPVVICFEAAFAGLTRSLVSGSDGPIVNLTSDGWFPGTGVGAWGRAQQMAHLPLRAAEHRSPLLRVANRGPSMLFDARGRLRWASAGAGVDVVTVPERGAPSPFTGTGDLLGPAAFLLLLLGLLRGPVESETARTLY